MASAFEQVIRLQLAKYSPEEAKRRHIAAARAGLAGFLAGQESRPGVAIETDGRPAASEDQVKPFGVITYRFIRMREIAGFALAQARELSPVRSGAYRKAWFLTIDNQAVAPGAIPQGAAEVLLVNDRPYARKIHVGAHGFEKYVPPGIVEKVRQLVLKRYRLIVKANIEFVTLQGGYELRGRRGRRAAAANRMSSAFRAGRAALAARKDTAAGQAMTYPALRLTLLHTR